MNYKPVVIVNQSNDSACTKACDNVGKVRVDTVPCKDYILLSFLTQDPPFSSSSKDSPDAGFKPSGEDEKKNTEDDAGKKFTEVPETESGVSSKEDDKDDQDLRDEFKSLIQQEKNGENDVNITNNINTDHPVEQIIRDIHSAPQTRRMTKNVTNHIEPKKVIQALTDPSWIEATQDELLQFKMQQVWTLVDLPYGKRAIGTK
ncbi:hypothetical protein Tco_0371951 [Tanacetum coccineum]